MSLYINAISVSVQCEVFKFKFKIVQIPLRHADRLRAVGIDSHSCLSDVHLTTECSDKEIVPNKTALAPLCFNYQKTLTARVTRKYEMHQTSEPQEDLQISEPSLCTQCSYLPMQILLSIFSLFVPVTHYKTRSATRDSSTFSPS
jgi:hypothetical protein